MERDNRYDVNGYNGAMNILFIGGTGLISTAIARQLLDAGHGVTLFNRGKSENRLPPGANVIVGDRHDEAALTSAAQSQAWDVVVDMVSFHPDATRAAVRAFSGHCGQFLHCSTVCVYSGPVAQIPTTETEPFHSIGGYGKNKAECERVLMEAFETDGFPATILRPSHSYGEGGGIIRAWGSYGYMAQFVDRLRKGKPIIIPGNGNSLWASCHVDDVARGFIGTMGNETCVGQAYNITGDEWMTWNEYHAQVAEAVGGTLNPVYIPTDTLLALAPDWTSGGT